MKKILCAALALVLSVGLFSACRPKIIQKPDTDYDVNIDIASDTEGTLRILVPTTDGGMEEGYIEALIPGFNELFPKVEIQLDRRAISDDRYMETISSAISSGEVPDLFYTNTVYYYYLVAENCIISLEPYYAAEQARYNETGGQEGLSLDADYYTEFFDMSTYDGNRYVVPRSMDSVVTYYNTEMLADAGINVKTDERLQSTEENPFTWNDLVSLCEEVSDYLVSAEGQQKYPLGYALQADLDWEAVFNAIMVSYGSQAFDEEGNVAIDSEATTAMATMLRNLYEDGGDYRIVRSNTSGSSFANGRVAFHFSSSGPASMALNAGVNGKFDALPFPLILDEDAGLTNPAIGCGFAGWGISSLADETTRDLAWQFLKYMISYDGQQALINAGMATPSIRIDLAEGKTWSKGYSDINLDAWLQWRNYKVSSKFFITQDPSATFDIYSALQNFMRNLVDPGLTGATAPRSVEMCIAICEEDLTEAIA